MINNTIELLKFDYKQIYHNEAAGLLDIHIDGRGAANGGKDENT